MSLLVRDIHLFQFRNFEDRAISLSPHTTILYGKNATGKTNTIEALQLITSGMSFRHPTSSELIHDGCDQGRVEGSLVGDGRVLDVSIEVDGGRKHFSLNGKRCRGSDISGKLISVLFCPEDLSLMKGSASLRRQEIDAFGCQASAAYRRLSHAYERAVEQRNKLLKEDVVDASLLDAWDESVALGGSSLLSHRLGLFSRLKTHFLTVCEELVPYEAIDCSYTSILGDDLFGLSRDELKERFAEELLGSRKNDIRRQQTLVGPHHDDIAFSIDGRDVRHFGSQGQQRSLVLAWKMAEVHLSEEITGTMPLLLLDDVMSELDEERRSAVLSFVNEGIQTVLSTTNLGYFSQEELSETKVVSYGEQPSI